MKFFRRIALVALGLTVSACATVDVPSRNLPFEPVPDAAIRVPDGYEALPQTDPLPALRISRVAVTVPRSLKVSESNSYLPKGDIVWREDPHGDRYAQVQAIVQAAMEQGSAGLDGQIGAHLSVEVQRFHALTQKARYTTGGIHAITFKMRLTDPVTGALLRPEKVIEADLKAFGGARALEAMARGQTQKVRITGHLASVIRQELTKPGSYKNPRLGLLQALQ
ncbi:hypothetical protein KUV26_00930 [Leisingera daeponensis]|uniref:Lipoprotein n=1 Tax=Leisingera daeponensis TaxID=405746 RepID=A0ABS7NAV9_9RHOB|nr:DUF6778 family protein [Leisingera daeponensis]MBY6054997.1 hypothetical protein [Leisingera daeponensis]MBY6137992.1 hypothetical protein [Leisingera daeponensis]